MSQAFINTSLPINMTTNRVSLNVNKWYLQLGRIRDIIKGYDLIVSKFQSNQTPDAGHCMIRKIGLPVLGINLKAFDRK
jgi:hypothetical protein